MIAGINNIQKLLSDVLKRFDISDTVEIRYSNIENVDVQCNNLVRYSKNPDILEYLSKNNKLRPKIVVGFSAETEDLIKNSKYKIRDKYCDLIVANDVSKKEIGFNSDFNKVSMIDQKGNIKILPKNKKSFIANKIAQILLDKLIDDRNIN